MEKSLFYRHIGKFSFKYGGNIVFLIAYGVSYIEFEDYFVVFGTGAT